jgi:hypothetical protein
MCLHSFCSLFALYIFILLPSAVEFVQTEIGLLFAISSYHVIELLCYTLYVLVGMAQ